jgi:serine/threonine protein kinase
MSKCLNPYCLHKNPDSTQFCQHCGSKLHLLQRYRSIDIIGEGGFGRTFLAVDECIPSKLNCVIKQLYPQAQGTNDIDKAARLFEKEAQCLEELGKNTDESGKHTQIPELLAYVTEGGHQYLVQEYINGQNLDQVLEVEGKFNEKQIQDVLEQVLLILDYVHQHQVVHRDVKPENIIRRQDGKLILVDFGASKRIPTGGKSTLISMLIGTPGYASPEQFQPQGKIKANSDIYSLGATCIHLLTQQQPYDLFDEREYKWIWRDYLDTPIEKRLGEILDKMLMLATESRYQSAAEVLQDLQFLKTQPLYSSEVELRSAEGYDYTKLRDLLAAGEWKKADQETANAMLKISDRQKEGWLDINSVDRFPTQDLQTIDRLWVKYSNGYFGFSVQKQIYQNLGGGKNYNRDLWNKFCDTIGWRHKGDWKKYEELSFTLTNSSILGHLPSCMKFLELWSGRGVALLSYIYGDFRNIGSSFLTRTDL